MAKKNELSLEQRVQIQLLHEQGMSQVVISKTVKCSRRSVQYAIQRFAATGSHNNRQRTGRKRITSDREDRKLVRESLKNRKKTASDLAAELAEQINKPISARTTRRRLQEAGPKGCKSIKKPWLSGNNRKARYEWALKYRSFTESDWSNIVWCDESNFETSTALMLLVHLSLHTVDEGHAINPSCNCIRFTSMHGKERGTFSSPDYPRPYPRNICLLYTFLAESHQIVELLFTDFDIYKEHMDCTNSDYLKVYSEGGVHGPGPPGINEYTPWSRILCGNRAEAPPALYSHGPKMVLELQSGEKASNASGFIGTYRFIDRRNFETDGIKVSDTLCDYVFTSQPEQPTHGRLYSERYPSSYPSNIKCNYHFNARKNERIKIFFEELYLQKGDESCLNRGDIIKVFDGRSSTAPVIAMLCNEIVGYEILSTGPEILIQFTAKSKTPGQGFKASYQFLARDSSSAEAEGSRKSNTMDGYSAIGPAVSAATSSCHQVFRSDKSRSGKLISPLYPSPYPQKTQCHYDFLARGRERVRLVFEDFNLQRASSITDCESMDTFDVFLYVDGRLEKMASYCGNDIPKPIMSNGPKLSIQFRGTYSSKTSKGFKISYYFVEDYGIQTGKQLLEFPCAFVYNSTDRRKGVMTSPNYPGLYPRDTECNYFFHAKKNERVHLKFSHFDVEGVVPCEAVSASDYVLFSSQMMDKGSQRHCGQLRELDVVSKSSFLRVTFRSNDRLDGTGFKAEYIFLKDSEMHSLKTFSSGTSNILREVPLWRYFLSLIIVHILKQ